MSVHTPSFGPDLASAEPIADVISRLARLRNGYSSDFLEACRVSGIHVTVERETSGEDRLMLGMPADDQDGMRVNRCNALIAQIKRGKFRRQQVIDHLNMLGRFLDNQPFSSVADIAAQYLEHGGRLWVDTHGRLGEAVPYHKDTASRESLRGYPLRRLVHRYAATIRRPGLKDALIAHVRKHGRLHNGSGCVVLEQEGPTDA